MKQSKSRMNRHKSNHSQVPIDIASLLGQFKSAHTGSANTHHIVVIGDIIVDRTFYVRRHIKGGEFAYEGPGFVKEGLRTSLGGAAALAQVIAMYYPVLLVFVQAGQGELNEYLQKQLKDLPDQQSNLVLWPIQGPSQHVCEITRIITQERDGNDRVELHFEEPEPVDLSDTQVDQIKEVVRSKLDASYYILADFDKGTITPNLISHIVRHIMGSNNMLIVQPYEDWGKYRDIPIHSLICRADQLDSAMKAEFPDGSQFADLPLESRFYIAFPKCQNLLIHDYSGHHLTAYVRKNNKARDIYVIRYLQELQIRRRFQTRSIGTAYYVTALNSGCSIRDSIAVAVWASDVASSTELHILPAIELLLPSQRIQVCIEQERRSIPIERAVIHGISRSGRIAVGECQTSLQGFVTEHEELRTALSNIESVLSLKNQQGERVPGILLHGDTGCGKGYLAECIAKTLKEKGRLIPMVIIKCQEYGLHARGARRPKEILQAIAQADGRIVLLDEVDKFAGYVRQCQESLMDFLDSSVINGKFVNVFIIATVSTDWQRQSEKRIQSPDFYSRFPGERKIYVPSISERIGDLPYVLANLFKETAARAISLGALDSILRHKHESFRSFQEDVETTKRNVGNSQTILCKHLPQKYLEGSIKDVTNVQFDYSC